jgi:hypothetical protein
MEVENSFQKVPPSAPSKKRKKASAKKQKKANPPPPSKSAANLPKKKKKPHDHPLITRTKISQETEASVRDIVLHDIPVTWSPKKILNELTSWGSTISLMIKKAA